MVFQCSSASRKFLNRMRRAAIVRRRCCFSALQRAENSSICRSRRKNGAAAGVSVLFSEPKIPQFPVFFSSSLQRRSFSALQRAENSSIWPSFYLARSSRSFSALQRAENSSIIPIAYSEHLPEVTFQCSSASRKFLNLRTNVATRRSSIPFQCSSASRKFLN